MKPKTTDPKRIVQLVGALNAAHFTGISQWLASTGRFGNPAVPLLFSIAGFT